MQLLQANPVVGERPSAQEAADMVTAEHELQRADVLSYVLGHRTFWFCKQRIAELHPKPEFGIPESEQDRVLMLVCCWVASKIEGSRCDKVSLPGVTQGIRMICAKAQGDTAVDTTCRDVLQLEWEVFQVYLKEVLPGYAQFLKWLGIEPAGDAVLAARFEMLGDGWYLCL
jgi:hypothetical protein